MRNAFCSSEQACVLRTFSDKRSIYISAALLVSHYQTGSLQSKAIKHNAKRNETETNITKFFLRHVLEFDMGGFFQWPKFAMLNSPPALLSIVLFHPTKSFVLPDFSNLLLTQFCSKTSALL